MYRLIARRQPFEARQFPDAEAAAQARSGYVDLNPSAQRFFANGTLRRIRIDLESLGVLPRRKFEQTARRFLGAGEVWNSSMRWKGKASQPLALQAVPDGLSGVLLI